MRRREFLERALLGCGAATLLGAFRSAGSPAPTLHVGPWLGDLGRDLDGTLALARALGVTAVEWPSPHAPFGRRPADVRAALDRAGLGAEGASIGTGLLYRGWDRMVDAARSLGVRRLTSAGPMPEERRAPEDWPEMIDVYARAAERARAAGMELAVHADAWMVGDASDRSPLARLVASPAAAGVRVALDAPTEGAVRLAGARLAALWLRPAVAADAGALARLRSAVTEVAPGARWIVVPGGGADASAEAVGWALRAVAR